MDNMSIKRSTQNKSRPYTQSLLIISQVYGPPNISRYAYIAASDPNFPLLWSRTFPENIGSSFHNRRHTQLHWTS